MPSLFSVRILCITFSLDSCASDFLFLYLWKPVLLVLFLLKIGTLLQVSATKRPLTMVFYFHEFRHLLYGFVFILFNSNERPYLVLMFFFVWTKQVIWIQLKQTIKLIISYCARSKSIWKEAVRRFKQVQCMYFQLRFDAIYMINKSKRKKKHNKTKQIT